MKCFAGRQKDIVHARALYKSGADRTIVIKQIDFLDKKRIPGSDRARIFFNELETFFEDRE